MAYLNQYSHNGCPRCRAGTYRLQLLSMNTRNTKVKQYIQEFFTKKISTIGPSLARYDQLNST